MLGIRKPFLECSNYLKYWSKRPFARSSHPRCSIKKVFLKLPRDSQENTCARASFLMKTLSQVFSCEFWEIFKNASCTEKLLDDCFWITVTNTIESQRIITKFCLSANYLKVNPTKWSSTLRQFVGYHPTNCLSVFDHFVGLALKGLSELALINSFKFTYYWSEIWRPLLTWPELFICQTSSLRFGCCF